MVYSMKKIIILGSTGSIGTQTLEVVREQKDIEVTALAAGKNIDLLEQQIIEFRPKMVSVADDRAGLMLKKRLGEKGITDTDVFCGMEGLLTCATEPSAELVVAAVVGMVGVLPTIAAIKAGKDIALANKETLVTAGHIIMPLLEQYNVKLYPVDSEHSAIFQCLQDTCENNVKHIWLTASGGPFRGKTKEDLKYITVEDALRHPNWSMGKKITIDSATMVNKGLEVIEAKWLFSMKPDDIKVVIQPQSVIHSMIEYEDGAVLAQLGVPDMKLPIQYAMYYPERRMLSGDRLDFYKLRSLDFYEPDMETFRGLKLAYDVIKEGGSMPVVYNAANERAVAMFLQKEISFLNITEYIEAALLAHKKLVNPTLEDVLEVEQETYAFIDAYRK